MLDVRRYEATLPHDIRGLGGHDLAQARLDVATIADQAAAAEGWQRVSATVVEFRRHDGPGRFVHQLTAEYHRDDP